MCANIDVPITANKPSCNVGAGFIPARQVPMGGDKPLPYDIGYCAECGLGCAPFRGLMILPF